MAMEGGNVRDCNESADPNIDLFVGQTFQNFEELLWKVQTREKMLGEKWVKGKSVRTVEHANSSIKNKVLHFRSDFVYARILFQCTHGGNFISRVKHSQRQATSNKMGCEARILAVADRKADALVLKMCNLQHNHGLSNPSDFHYASLRQPSPLERKEIENLLAMKMPVSHILKLVMEKFGKKMTAQDIHNIRKKMVKTQQQRSSDAGEDLWNVMTEMSDKDSHSRRSHTVVANDERKGNFLYFQTSEMKRLLQTFSDVLYIDSSYSFSQLGFPLYTLFVVDGNNTGHPVCYAAVRDERKATLSDLVKEFISLTSISLKTIVIDKSIISELEEVRKGMPDINLLLCRFYVAKALKEGIAKKCNEGEHGIVFEVVGKMLHCSDEAVYWECYGKLPTGALLEYFDEKWHAIKESWALCFSKEIIPWGNKTDNFIEKHTKTFEKHRSREKNLPLLIKSLLNDSRMEEDNLAQILKLVPLRTNSYEASSDIPVEILIEIGRYAAPHATDLIKQQLEVLYKMKSKFRLDTDKRILYVHHIGQRYTESFHMGDDGSCKCRFYAKTKLPCWHRFALRRELGEPVFCPSDIPSHLSKDNNETSKNFLQRQESSIQLDEETGSGKEGDTFLDDKSCNPDDKKELSDEERKHILEDLMNRLMEVLMDCDEAEFHRRIKLLEDIIRTWESGSEYEILTSENLNTVQDKLSEIVNRDSGSSCDSGNDARVLLESLHKSVTQSGDCEVDEKLNYNNDLPDSLHTPTCSKTTEHKPNKRKNESSVVNTVYGASNTDCSNSKSKRSETSKRNGKTKQLNVDRVLASNSNDETGNCVTTRACQEDVKNALKCLLDNKDKKST